MESLASIFTEITTASKQLNSLVSRFENLSLTVSDLMFQLHEHGNYKPVKNKSIKDKPINKSSSEIPDEFLDAL